jgi:hypothetical protein
LFNNSVTSVIYDRDDIDEIIRINSYRYIYNLDSVLFPSRPRSKVNSCLPIGSRPRQTINHLIKYFLKNPISSDSLDPYWYESDIPHFLNVLLEKFPTDQIVIKLLQIPNIKKIMSI